MTISNFDYNVDFPVGEQQIARILNLFKRNSNEKSLAHLKWQYLISPGGGAYTAISVSPDGVDAAVYSVFKVYVKINRDLKLACQSLDTLTDQNHRGKGLFSGLADAIFKKCENDEIAFVYGFPNSNSAPGFFNKLGWSRLGHPPFRIYLNNLLFPLAFILKRRIFVKNYLCLSWIYFRSWFLKHHYNLKIKKSIDYKSLEYEKLWTKFSKKLPVTLWRSGEYMCWRYQEKPDKLYYHLSAYYDDKLVGLVVFTVLEKHGGRIGYVMDLIYDPDSPAAGSLLLTEAVRKMNALNVDAILAWADLSFSVNKPYLDGCFFKLPRKLQPIKLYFGYKFLNLKDKNAFGMSEFYVSYADSDTV